MIFFHQVISFDAKIVFLVAGYIQAGGFKGQAIAWQSFQHIINGQRVKYGFDIMIAIIAAAGDIDTDVDLGVWKYDHQID